MADNTLPNPKTQVLAKQLAMIDDFLLDCLLSDAHEYESEVTEFPVETGSDITDNVRPKPIVVTMEVIVSNSPIGQLTTLRDSPDTSADECYAKLQQIYAAREPVTIRTSLNTFVNMVMKNLSIPRSADRGDAIRFTATFQQIQIVTNKRRQVRRAIPKTPQKQLGSQPASPVTVPPDYTVVVSFNASFRATVSKSLGAPILTTLPLARAADNGGFDGLGLLDHYKSAGQSTRASGDGYVKAGHYIRTSFSGGGTLTLSNTCINGTPVHYDYGQHAWLDNGNNNVVKTVPPGIDRWKGVTATAGNGVPQTF